jgi:5-(carboxyamino)imidazole ribonucleotide mutase
MKDCVSGGVAILTGSPNDLDLVRTVQRALTDLQIPSELRVLSAHRSPELTVDYVRAAEARGVEVFVACAGMANHLAGTVAAHTRLPVIGVPLVSGQMNGMDSLLSTVQMPPGVPVATVSIDGVRNAAFLAARILGIKYPAIRARLEQATRAERDRYAEMHVAAEKADGRGPAAAARSRRSAPSRKPGARRRTSR